MMERSYRRGRWIVATLTVGMLVRPILAVASTDRGTDADAAAVSAAADPTQDSQAALVRDWSERETPAVQLLPPGYESHGAKLPNAGIRLASVGPLASVSPDEQGASAADSTAPLAQVAQASPAGGGTAAAAPAPDNSRFIGRFLKAYWDDFNGTTPDLGPVPPKRGYPYPVNSPPYPWSDWPYGGSYDVGAPDTSGEYPLTRALYGTGPIGDFFKDNKIKIWGWVEMGANVSSSHAGANRAKEGTPGFPTAGTNYANAPAAYSAIPNTIQPDQVTLYINRYADETQLDHFDWGFRLTNLYGFDYRYTITKGIFSNQLLDRNARYGYDPVMFWLEGYWPILQGLNVRLGRYISLPDIEAQLAPDNLTYSHSLTYTFDCYTQTGLNSTLKINDNWLIQAGLSAGNDVTAWTSGKDKHPTFNTCIQTTWNDGKDANYICANSINLDGADARYGYNNMAAYYETWYHKFNDKWFMATEYWYQYERDVPSIFGTPQTTAHLEANANGGWCAPGQQFCMTKEDSAVNYIEYQYDDNTAFTLRNDYFNDQQGQRTGVKDFYSEHLIGLTHFFSNDVFIRPEVRYDHAYNRPSYDNQTKTGQIMLAADLVFRY